MPVDFEDTRDVRTIEGEILKFIRRCEGYKIRLRELHWNTKSNSQHKLSDDLLSAVTGYEDDIAETFMGIIGIRIKVGDIIPIMPRDTELSSVIDSFRGETLRLRDILDAEPDCAGIINTLDDMATELDKSLYLSTMR